MPDGRPVPTALKLLRGNPGKKPIRPEPMPTLLTTVPEPPEFLGELAREIWRELAPELHRLRLLTSIDLNLFAGYCAAFARWRQVQDELVDAELTVINGQGAPVKNPLLSISNEAAKEMLAYATHFGLSPIARARLGAAPFQGKASNKFDGLLAG